MSGSVFAAGLVFGLLVGYVVGKAVARALRAWRDLMDTKKKIVGLWRRVVGEWLIVVKVGAVAGLVVAVAVTGGLWAVLR